MILMGWLDRKTSTQTNMNTRTFVFMEKLEKNIVE